MTKTIFEEKKFENWTVKDMERGIKESQNKTQYSEQEQKIIKTIRNNKKVWNALQEHGMDTTGAMFQHEGYLNGIKDALGETKTTELENKAIDLLTEEKEGLA